MGVFTRWVRSGMDAYANACTGISYRRTQNPLEPPLFLVIYWNPKNLATILIGEGKFVFGSGLRGVWARWRGFMGARQLFFCDLRYRVAFGSIFALKFDLIRENYEANATFSANFCLNGCFCWKSMQLFLYFSRETVVYGGGAVARVKCLPRILFGLQ